MGTPREPKPAKYFVALLSSDSEFLTTVESDLAAILGVVDSRSEILPWTASNFYQREIGGRFAAPFPLVRNAGLSG